MKIVKCSPMRGSENDWLLPVLHLCISYFVIQNRNISLLLALKTFASYSPFSLFLFPQWECYKETLVAPEEGWTSFTFQFWGISGKSSLSAPGSQLWKGGLGKCPTKVSASLLSTSLIAIFEIDQVFFICICGDFLVKEHPWVHGLILINNRGYKARKQN